MIDGLSPEQIHKPVLLDEVIEYLSPESGKIYVDGTVGLGGHSEAILEKSAPEGRVIGFEWDEAAIEQNCIRLERFENRYVLVRKNFAQLLEGLSEQGVSKIDGLLIDIGLSSLQLDTGSRGFSFRFDEQLDMRMDVRGSTTAATLINGCSEEELADIFFYYGEEKQARPMAAAIVTERKKKAIETTGQLVEIVSAAVPKRFHPNKIHVATKVFQALRIAVNKELENLSQILNDATDVLEQGARMCVISFHSLEDRMVKRRFKADKTLRVLTSKPVVANRDEQIANPRSRSAKLRVAEKI